MSGDNTERIRISASKLRTWMQCPLQAKFQYVDKLPRGQNSSASYGACIHHALQIYNQTGDVEAAISDFIHTWEHPEELDVVPDTWTKGTNFGSLRSRGLATLRNYHEQVKWDSREVIATEHPFVVPFGEFDIVGFIDLVEGHKDGRGNHELHIVDYKTNKKQPFRNNLPWDVQFTCYSYAPTQREFWFGTDDSPPVPDAEVRWERYKNSQPRGYWYHLETNKEIFTGLRDDEDYMRLYRIAKEMARALEYEVYVPNLSGDSCTFCSYQKPCGLPIPKKDEML